MATVPFESRSFDGQIAQRPNKSRRIPPGAPNHLIHRRFRNVGGSLRGVFDSIRNRVISYRISCCVRDVRFYSTIARALTNCRDRGKRPEPGAWRSADAKIAAAASRRNRSDSGSSAGDEIDAGASRRIAVNVIGSAVVIAPDFRVMAFVNDLRTESHDHENPPKAVQRTRPRLISGPAKGSDHDREWI
jgi:hypothetical protein